MRERDRVIEIAQCAVVVVVGVAQKQVREVREGKAQVPSSFFSSTFASYR
jgi:hypothetical protein